LTKPVDIEVLLKGSMGASFKDDEFTESVRSTIEAKTSNTVATVLLRGDWDLKIKFNYTIRHTASPAVAKVGSVEEHLEKGMKTFRLFPYDISPLDEVRTTMKNA